MDDFLEGDDAFPEPRRRPRRAARKHPPRETERPSAEHRRQIMQRRLTAFGGGVLIIILLVLGVRGCLDARKTRAFENYANDLAEVVTESNQLSKSFFNRLKNPVEEGSDLSFENQIQADRGTAEGLLDRTRSIDTPGEVSEGQSDVILAFELRRDGLAAIGSQVGAALGDKGRNKAIGEITRNMRMFIAGDVLFERARSQVNSALEAEEIDAIVPESQFLPNTPDYLDRTVVDAALAGVAGGGGPTTGGVHGLGLISVSVGGVALTQGAEATISASGTPELIAEVQNQGESRESDIPVSFTLRGGGESIRGQETISAIEPGESQTITLPISPPPPSGQSLTLRVLARPVLGEQVAENNEATYTVIFG